MSLAVRGQGRVVAVVCALAGFAAGCSGGSGEPGAGAGDTPCESWHVDADGDGFGDRDGAPVEVCSPADEAGHVPDASDCDDADPAVNPAAAELCAPAGVDEDCDGLVDTADDSAARIDTWADADGDGHGDPNSPVTASCAVDPGRAPVGDDCDDAAATVYPGAPALCDGLPNDCVDAAEVEDGLITVFGAAATPYPALQDALDAAVAGDEVRVCPGVYVGAFVAVNPVNLVGFGGRDATTLDAQDLGAVLTVPAGSTVAGLTLTGGFAESGGGLTLTGAGALEVRDCAVTDNAAHTGGGLLIPPGAVVSLPGTSVTANRATTGGGIYAGADTALDLTGATVEGNTAEAGGGVHGVSVSIVGGVVASNEATDEYSRFDGLGGGGLALFGDCAVTGTEVTDNVARFNGGGLTIDGGALTLTDAVVARNQASGGGGVHVGFGDALTMLGATEVSENDAGGFGGGVQVYDGGSVTGGVVRANSSYESGGMYIGQGAIAQYVEVRDNEASVGAGVEVRGGTLLDLVIDGNHAGWAGGVYADTRWYYGAVTIDGCTITHNTSDSSGGGVYLTANQTAPVLTNLVVTDNTARYGAAFGVDMDLVPISDSVILRNTATDEGSGALRAELDGRIRVTNCDLGEGVDDNLPGDVDLRSGPLSGYGAGATFDCTETACSPLP